MASDRWTTTFHAGSAVHAAVVLAVVAGCVAVVGRGRAARRRGVGGAFDRTFARVLLAVWFGLLAYNLMPSRLRWDKSLPLHVCDVVGLAAPVGLLTGRRLPRAILYFWGVAYVTQAFVTPGLFRGPTHPDFWAFWLCHAVIVMAAAYEVAVRGYRPTWRDWRLTVAAAAVYVPVVVAVNVRLGTNYGYLGRTDFAQAAAVLRFGPWPGRVSRLFLAGAAGTLALVLPWTVADAVVRRRGRSPVRLDRRLRLVQPTPARRAA